MNKSERRENSNFYVIVAEGQFVGMFEDETCRTECIPNALHFPTRESAQLQLDAWIAESSKNNGAFTKENSCVGKVEVWYAVEYPIIDYKGV